MQNKIKTIPPNEVLYLSLSLYLNEKYTPKISSLLKTFFIFFIKLKILFLKNIFFLYYFKK